MPVHIDRRALPYYVAVVISFSVTLIIIYLTTTDEILRKAVLVGWASVMIMLPISIWLHSKIIPSEPYEDPEDRAAQKD